jgi:HEAT repeat protein
MAAVTALCGLEGEGGDGALLEEALRRDPVPRVRARAARCPAGLGAEPLLALKAALGDANLGVRLAAIEGLAATGDPAALAIVEELARGPLDVEAVAAAAELCRAGMEVGRERLDAALEDERPSLRKAALLRLERAGVEDRDALLEGLLADESPEVVLLVASLLGTREELGAEVRDALGKLVDEDGASAAAARDQLAVLGDGESVEAVGQLLAEAEEAEALTVLRRVRRAVGLAPIFVGLMGDARLEVRLAAARAVLATVDP